jgi:hypothetical protein
LEFCTATKLTVSLIFTSSRGVSGREVKVKGGSLLGKRESRRFVFSDRHNPRSLRS